MELNKKQKVLYHFIRTVFYLISLLPMRLLYVLSDMAYPFVFAFYRRKLVRQQLTECFPEKDIKEIKAIEHAFYHQFCDTFVEMIKQFSMSKEEMMRRMVFVDADKACVNFSDEQKILFLMRQNLRCFTSLFRKAQRKNCLSNIFSKLLVVS